MDDQKKFSITDLTTLPRNEQKKYLDSLDLDNKKQYLEFYNVDIVKDLAKELFNEFHDYDSDRKTLYFSYQEKDRYFDELGTFQFIDFAKNFDYLYIDFKLNNRINTLLVYPVDLLDYLYSDNRTVNEFDPNNKKLIKFYLKKHIKFYFKDDNITYTDVKLYDKEEKENFTVKANRIGEGGARNKSKKQLKKVKKSKKRTRKQRRKQRSKRMFSIK